MDAELTLISRRLKNARNVYNGIGTLLVDSGMIQSQCHPWPDSFLVSQPMVHIHHQFGKFLCELCTAHADRASLANPARLCARAVWRWLNGSHKMICPVKSILNCVPPEGVYSKMSSPWQRYNERSYHLHVWSIGHEFGVCITYIRPVALARNSLNNKHL